MGSQTFVIRSDAGSVSWNGAGSGGLPPGRVPPGGGHTSGSDDGPVFLSPQDVSELLKIALKTVYGWRSKDTGPPSSKIGRHVRYELQAVLEWFRQQGIPR